MCRRHCREEDLLSPWVDAGVDPFPPSLHRQSICSRHVVFLDAVERSISAKLESQMNHEVLSLISTAPSLHIGLKRKIN